ncbi:serine/threonine-protein kinase Nek, partial [Acrasis kona]
MSDEEDKKSSIDEEKEQVLPPIALKKKTTVDHSHGKSIKDFHITRKLGGGAEGAVFLATRLEDKEKIAMKCIIRHSEKDIKRTREELGFLMTLRHENIVDHMMFFEDVKKSFTGEETRFYLVMEYSEDGSLEDYIIAQKKLNQTISVETILKWTTQICECMRYMHKDGLIHRDIKSENLLLSNNHQTMKVCDFGFTKKTEKVLSGTVLGTIVYMAPEIFANTRYDESIDIWSLGVVLLQLILMKNQKEVPDVRIEVGGNPDYIYEFLSDYDTRVTSIVEACLRIDPIDRPTAAEILKHIKNLEDNSGSNATIRRIFTSSRKKKKNVVRPDEVIDDSDMMSLSDALSATMTDTSSQTNSPRGSDSIFRKNSSDDSTLAADGPLCQMSTQKARKFWIDNGWVNQYKVEWLEFREAYRKLMGWNLIPKESERGLKSILIGGDSDFDSEMVSCTAFDRAVLRTGFPFSDQFMHSVWEKSRAEDSELTDRELTQLYASDLSQEEYQHHREEYLRTLIDYDKIFIDPISQEPLSVDSHCAPLRLVTDEEWGELMANEYDMDLEDDKMTRIERLSAWRGHSRSQQQENAINYLTNTERKEHRFIVLGAAAAGKTCMMKLLMYKAAIKSRSEGYLVPLFVPIANLAYNNTHAITDDICGFYLECIRASADSMMNNSLRYDTRIEHFLMHALRHEEALILLDGLDEAANPDVKRRIELAIAEIARVHRNGIIITSRVSGFDSDEDGRNLFHDFTLARIQPLTFPIQLQIALKRGVIDDNFHNSLKGKYRELAQTPLLLSLLIQQFKEKGKLPDLRSELYGEAISTMITVFFRKNEPDKKLADMEREREEILHLLSALACKLHAERRRDFVQADVINNTVTSTTMMNLAMGNRPLSRNSSVQGNIGYGGGGGGAGSAGGGGGGELDGFNTNEEDSDLRAYDEEGRLISREKLVHTWDRLKNWVDQ